MCDVSQKIADAVTTLREVFSISQCEYRIMPFTEWPNLKQEKGVYIIVNGDEVLYVGRGIIRRRQESHYKKLNGTLTKHDNKEPKGWQHFREHHVVDCTKLMLYIVVLYTDVDEAAMEGGLIKLLLPYVNNEVYLSNVKMETHK